jgi:hypothetical protein
MPPVDLVGFAPSPELLEWTLATFVDEGGELHNPDHSHLAHAKIGMVWAGWQSKIQGRVVLGQCEMIMGGGGRWSKLRGQYLLDTWFEDEIDFLITLYAPACLEMSDREFCALVEHELYHAGRKLDDYGNAVFDTQTGAPKFALRPHDVEEFVGVVERYGATSPALRTMAESIMAGPLFDDEPISHACGTCVK